MYRLENFYLKVELIGIGVEANFFSSLEFEKIKDFNLEVLHFILAR
jgi:hypothetical protein